MRYQIMGSRQDVSPYVILDFERESDKKALRKYEKYKNNAAYNLENLVLLRIDQDEKIKIIDRADDV